MKKFVNKLSEVTFSGKIALKCGFDMRYTTERAVFTLKVDGFHLIETVPGVSLQEDILDKMDFTPVISLNPRLMDERLSIDASVGFILLDAANQKEYHDGPFFN